MRKMILIIFYVPLFIISFLLYLLFILFLFLALSIKNLDIKYALDKIIKIDKIWKNLKPL